MYYWSSVIFWQILLITTITSYATKISYNDPYFNTENQKDLDCYPYRMTPAETRARKRSLFPKNCGTFIVSDRIIGGRTAEIGQFPWMAFLGYQQPSVEFTQFLCGGSLISKRYVLTAAHCLSLHPKLNLAVVRLGELDILKDIDCSSGQDKNVCADSFVDISVEKTIKHKQYNNTTFKNDIALIRLAKPVRFTEYIRPICLPFDENFDHLIGRKLTFSGWGKTKPSNAVGSTTLQFTKVKIWSRAQCNRLAPPKIRPIARTQLCATGEINEDACGGPLSILTVENSQPQYTQLGVVSLASTVTCGNPKIPTIYTRVDRFLKWILNHVY